MQSLFNRFCAALVVAPGLRIILLALILCASLCCKGSAAAETGKPGVLVLTNGRVIGGRIDQNAGGFIVRSENGNIQVPFDRVRLRAANLHDAYKRMLSSFPNPSPQTHVALANWCMTQQLYDETKIELRSALKLNPTYVEARNMLRRLEEILSPSSGAEVGRSNDPQKTVDGFEPPPASSLAGISRETAIEFVTRVQPLMMNSCALAGCHAAGGPTQFQLQRVRSGPRSSRALTERNLAATLRYVDPSDADGSSLITLPRGNHGRGGRPILTGPRGNDHFKLLRQWVRRVAADKPVSTKKTNRAERAITNKTAGESGFNHNLTVQPGRQQTPPVGRAFDEFAGGPTPRRNPDTFRRTSSENVSKSKTAGDITEGDPLLQEILRQERRDAFDPAEFNRQTNGERR